MLKRLDFAEYGSRGELLTLYCKVCGIVIGDIVPNVGFRRNSHYAELKMKCDDGSSHVTNGCKGCLSPSTPKRILTAMLAADMEDQRPSDAGPNWDKRSGRLRKATNVTAHAIGKAAV